MTYRAHAFTIPMLQLFAIVTWSAATFCASAAVASDGPKAPEHKYLFLGNSFVMYGRVYDIVHGVNTREGGPALSFAHNLRGFSTIEKHLKESRIASPRWIAIADHADVLRQELDAALPVQRRSIQRTNKTGREKIEMLGRLRTLEQNRKHLSLDDPSWSHVIFHSWGSECDNANQHDRLIELSEEMMGLIAEAGAKPVVWLGTASLVSNEPARQGFLDRIDLYGRHIVDKGGIFVPVQRVVEHIKSQNPEFPIHYSTGNKHPSPWISYAIGASIYAAVHQKPLESTGPFDVWETKYGIYENLEHEFRTISSADLGLIHRSVNAVCLSGE